MQQLSGLDAFFIYMETPRTPMHIGSVYLLDVSKAKGFSHERLIEHIRSRLPLLPVLRQRLVEVPLDLGHPFWVNDPDFSLDAHVIHMGCPRPGGKRELMELAAHLFARPLNRTRPLWEFVFVDGVDRYPGLPAGSCAVICRVHHAAVDGVSGAELMGALLDVDPRPRAIDAHDDWEPEALPGSLDLVRRTYAKLGRKSLDLARFVRDTAAGSAKLAWARRKHLLEPPTLPLKAPQTPLNAVVRAGRLFGGVEFELDAIKALRKLSPGATVNDVLLTVCAGALRRHLLRIDALPDDPLVAMVPISVRPRNDAPSGNQVSAMFVELATDEPDARRRLARIHRAATSQKAYSSALPASRIMDFVPSETAALATRLYTRMRVADKHQPFFNLVITNVPGPPRPLYLAGSRVHSVFGTAPLFDGLGLILVIFSQAGKISIGITGAANTLEDVTPFESDLRAAFDALSEPPVDSDVQAPEPTSPMVDDPVSRLRSAVAALGDSIETFRKR